MKILRNIIFALLIVGVAFGGFIELMASGNPVLQLIAFFVALGVGYIFFGGLLLLSIYLILSDWPFNPSKPRPKF